jgi:cell filamentation protein
MRLLALEKGLILHLNPPDNLDIYNRYMLGTINGDVEILAVCDTNRNKKQQAI